MIQKLTTYFQYCVQSNWKVFALLVVLSVLFRILSFSYSVIDHDESTYLVIANELNKGAKLYTDVIDTKPPGIFLPFSLVETLAGKSIFAIRLLGSLIISLSAFLLFLIAQQLGSNRTLSFFTGLSYIVIFSCYRYGLAVNTELFFSFFALAGLTVLFKAEQANRPALWLIGGTLIGFGFIFKYVVLAGYGAFCLFFLLEKSIFSKLGSKLIKFLLGLIGVLLPFLIIHLYFYSNGRFDDFYETIYGVTSRYSSVISAGETFSFFFKFHLAYLPFILLFYYGLLNKNVNQDTKRLAIYWFVLAWIVVLLPGKPFKHYYLQLAPPLSLMVPLAFNRLLSIKPLSTNFKIKLVGLSVAVALLVGIVNQSYFWVTPDPIKQITAKLAPHLTKNDFILADKDLQLAHYLLDLTPPTKYVHPTIIFQHHRAFQLDTEQEMNRMLDKNPKFILYDKLKHYFEANQRIQNNYHFYERIEGVTILERNP